MKKVICLLIVALATPAMAGDITLVATNNGDGTCTISYTTTSTEPVGIALDVDVTSGQVDSIDGIDSFFDIYLDYAYDDPTGYNYGDGHPVANQVAAGALTLPQPNFALCMGGLGGEILPLEGPPVGSGVIAVLHAATPTTGEITLNDLRGAIIDTAGDPMNVTGVPLAFDIGSIDCLQKDQVRNGITITQLNIDAWELKLKPPEWCNHCFTIGDVNNDCVGTTGDLFPVLDGMNPALGYTTAMDVNMDAVATTGDLFKVLDFMNPALPLAKCHVSCVPFGPPVTGNVPE